MELSFTFIFLTSGIEICRKGCVAIVAIAIQEDI